MHYAEFPAPPELSALVRCVWIFRADFGSDTHEERIVPDGSPEVILHFGAPYLERVASGRWKPQPPLLLAGNLTRPLLLQCKGKVGVLGVRLWPHAVSMLAGIEPATTIDQRMPLAVPATTVQRWRQHLNSLTNDSAGIEVVPELLRTLQQSVALPDPAASWACAEIFMSRGQASADHLAQGTGLSLRQLQRRMRAATGLSLQRLASLVRFRAVFDELNADIPSPWLSAALAAGYFDQAHMIRDFKRYAGQPPRAFLANAGALSTAIVSASI